MSGEPSLDDAGRGTVDWLGSVAAGDGFAVERWPLAQSGQWRLDDGSIIHRTGRFFRVTGLRCGSFQQPIIEQREIGTLAFLIRRTGHGPEILLHAKVEPGNVNVAQIAPSVQATASNLDQVHGGARPWGAAYVASSTATRLSNTLESEQATRFLDKLNRNLSIVADVDPSPGTPFRWVPVTTLLRLLDRDFVVNTDARSVLATMPWDVLAPNGPFTAPSDEFGEALRDSFARPADTAVLATSDQRLALARRSGDAATAVPLDALDGWDVGADGGVTSAASPLSVRHIRVSSRSREVSQWDQPILDTAHAARADLTATRVAGTLRFGFSLCREPGLLRRVELGPTWLGLETATAPDGSETGRVVAHCRQSDEGGRFFQDVTLYRILDLGERAPDPAKLWLSLSEIRALLDRGGYLTNEARTLISLLMRRLVS
ncbi:MAG TPA: NDP-hexose 2,3-dehydratase family protein [Vineibacter sp.]|nr:NDP-hexose 2,3-dehydratase family protein [Vineibacter sp.]